MYWLSAPPETWDELAQVALKHLDINAEEEGMARHASWRIHRNHLWTLVYY